jgi:hypothetical protein
MLQTIRNYILAWGGSLCAIQASTVSAAAGVSWLWISDAKLRNGDITIYDIPLVILSVTNFLLTLVGTVAMIMIIYGALRMGYGAVTDDKEAGKKIISAGIVGFVISVSGWFIINFIIDNL